MKNEDVLINEIDEALAMYDPKYGITCDARTVRILTYIVCQLKEFGPENVRTVAAIQRSESEIKRIKLSRFVSIDS